MVNLLEIVDGLTYQVAIIIEIFTKYKYIFFMNVTLSTSYGDFEWDSEKEAAHRRKHGLGFALAAEALADEHGVYIQDDEHSFGEERQRGRMRGNAIK